MASREIAGKKEKKCTDNVRSLQNVPFPAAVTHAAVRQEIDLICIPGSKTLRYIRPP